MNKLRIFKSISAIALMGTMTLTGLTGCAKKEKSFLSDTDLETTKVISFEDGHKDIAVIEGIRCGSTDNCTEKMYRSIITNEYFTNNECTGIRYFYGYKEPVLNHYDIINDESIVSFLTPEEIAKAAKGELTDEDVVTIVNRILSNEKEKTNTK